MSVSLLYVGRFTTLQKRSELFICLCKELSTILPRDSISVKMFLTNEPVGILDELVQLIPDCRIVISDRNWQQQIVGDEILVSTSEYEGCPLTFLEFTKAGGLRFASLYFTGVDSYLSRNCIFSSIHQMAVSIAHGFSTHNQLSLVEYFDFRRFSREIHSALP
jgi:hypothetical protein